MAEPYLLVEFLGDTRKIIGDYYKPSQYGRLMKRIVSKFEFDRDQKIQAQILDPDTNKYYNLTRNNMEEIPVNGVVRVLAGRNGMPLPPRPLAKKTAKAPASPPKSPGKPVAKAKPKAKRNRWRIGTEVQVVSGGNDVIRQKGRIYESYSDQDGHWVVIQCDDPIQIEAKASPKPKAKPTRPVQPQKPKPKAKPKPMNRRNNRVNRRSPMNRGKPNRNTRRDTDYGGYGY